MSLTLSAITSLIISHSFDFFPTYIAAIYDVCKSSLTGLLVQKDYDVLWVILIRGGYCTFGIKANFALSSKTYL